ncbi:MAG: helix-turn-helix transcriptional regulator [Clostridia bacterium]|nr:helix-turn-helix transcriptional regulator [Clostridia bacterium]
MKDLNNIIADNLIRLRKANKLTQLELAQKLNYSDKAISKWERGESMPDIYLFKQLAEMYGVSLDYLTTEHSAEETVKYKKPGQVNNKLIITLLACLLVWICATIIYVNIILIYHHYYWMIWLWAVPVSCIVLIVFSSIWANKFYVLTTISCFIWSMLACFYLQFIKYNIWSIFLIGIPAQIAVFLWGKLKSAKNI